MTYNFLDNNFTTFENVETPKVQLDMPLMDAPLDISNWSTGVTEKGTPIIKDNVKSKMIINNTEEATINKPTAPILLNTNLQGRLKQAMEFFLNKGLSAHAAAGIVGNLMLESGLNTTIKGDKGKALGLALWHPDRQKGLKALALSRGTDISDFDTQLEYVWQELNSSHKTALQRLLNSTNVELATTAFMKHFERPGIKRLERRIGYAKSLVS